MEIWTQVVQVVVVYTNGIKLWRGQQPLALREYVQLDGTFQHMMSLHYLSVPPVHQVAVLQISLMTAPLQAGEEQMREQPLRICQGPLGGSLLAIATLTGRSAMVGRARTSGLLLRVVLVHGYVT